VPTLPEFVSNPTVIMSDGSVLMLLFCAGGIYASYITYGYLQEGVYGWKNEAGESFKDFSTATLTILLFQTLLSGGYALIATLAKGDTFVPALDFALPGFTYIGAMLCSNEALRYVNYPTQVLAKSCKLVPVMLVNVLYYHRKQTVGEYIQVLLVTSGIVLFRYKAGKEEGEGNTTYGIVLLALSLLMDGITGPTQEYIRDRYRPSSEQFMLYCNMWAVIYILIGLFILPDGFESIRFLLLPQNSELLMNLLIFSVCGTLGQNFIFLTLRHFGYVCNVAAAKPRLMHCLFLARLP
jgi:UDP-galactose transporter B1